MFVLVFGLGVASLAKSAVGKIGGGGGGGGINKIMKKLPQIVEQAVEKVLEKMMSQSGRATPQTGQAK